MMNHESTLDKVFSFVWCHSNEIRKDDCQKKTSKFLKSFKIGGLHLKDRGRWNYLNNQYTCMHLSPG